MLLQSKIALYHYLMVHDNGVNLIINISNEASKPGSVLFCHLSLSCIAAEL